MQTITKPLTKECATKIDHTSTHPCIQQQIRTPPPPLTAYILLVVCQCHITVATSSDTPRGTRSYFYTDKQNCEKFIKFKYIKRDIAHFRQNVDPLQKNSQWPIPLTLVAFIHFNPLSKLTIW